MQRKRSSLSISYYRIRNISAHAEKAAIISVYCFIDPLYIMVLSLANLVKNQRQSTNTTYLY